MEYQQLRAERKSVHKQRLSLHQNISIQSYGHSPYTHAPYLVEYQDDSAGEGEYDEEARREEATELSHHEDIGLEEGGTPLTSSD